MLIATDLGFDWGQYSYTMALTALRVYVMVSPSQPRLLWMCLGEKNLMLTSQACFVMAAILLFASIDGGLGPLCTPLLGFAFCVWRLLVEVLVSRWAKRWSCYSERAGVASSGYCGVSQVCNNFGTVYLVDGRYRAKCIEYVGIYTGCWWSYQYCSNTMG